MILSLELENWKSHQKTSLKFSEGTNVLVGIMGSGKSSILDAINFALFGTYPALSQKRISLKDNIRKKPNKAKYARVTLRFQGTDGQEYEAKRTIGENTEAELRQEGNLIEFSPKKVTERIEGLLKADYDLFSKAIYSEQNQMDYFLTLPKGKRKEKIDELLRIDRFEEARKTAMKIDTTFSTVIQEKETYLKKEEKETEGLEALAKETEGLERKRQDAANRLKASKERKEELEKRLEGLERKKETHGRLEARAEMLEKRGKDIAAQAGRYKGTDKTEKELEKEIILEQEALRELEKREKELRALEPRKQEIQGRKRALEEAIAEEMEKTWPADREKTERLREEKKKAELEIERWTKEANRLAGETIGLERAVKSLETETEAKARKKEMLDRLDRKNTEEKAAGTKKELALSQEKTSRLAARLELIENGIKELSEGRTCPLCGSELTDPEEIARHKMEEAEEARKEKEAEEKKAGELKKEQEMLEDTLAKARQLEIALSDHEEKKAELDDRKKELGCRRKEKQAADEGLRENKKSIEELKKRLEAGEKALEAEAGIEKKKTKIRLLEEELARIEKEMMLIREGYSKETEEKKRKELENRKELLEGVRIRSEQTKTYAELEEKKQELKELAYNREKHELHKAGYQAETKEWEKSIADLSALSAELLEKKKRAEELRKRREKTEEERRNIEKMKKNTDYLKEFQNALTKTQVSLREEFIQVVNESMESMWTELYPYKDYTSARIEIEEGDYALKLLGTNGWTPVEAVSGGERAVAVLALRIAFSLVLAPQLRWLILDEPTHNLDQRGVEELATLLREKIGEYMDQIFVITHDPGLEQAATGYLYRLERDKGRDEPTKVMTVDAMG